MADCKEAQVTEAVIGTTVNDLNWQSQRLRHDDVMEKTHAEALQSQQWQDIFPGLKATYFLFCHLVAIYSRKGGVIFICFGSAWRSGAEASCNQTVVFSGRKDQGNSREHQIGTIMLKPWYLVAPSQARSKLATRGSKV